MNSCSTGQGTVCVSGNELLNARNFSPLWIAGLTLVLLSGCAALTPLTPYPIAPFEGKSPLPEHPFKTFSGVIHVHTEASHDSQGTLQEVVQAAQAVGLDFVILTEHNKQIPLEKSRFGRKGELLVLSGSEISAAQGHYLALGVTRQIERQNRTTQQVIDEVPITVQL